MTAKQLNKLIKYAQELNNQDLLDNFVTASRQYKVGDSDTTNRFRVIYTEVQKRLNHE